jgi:hypothetical protein
VYDWLTDRLDWLTLLPEVNCSKLTTSFFTIYPAAAPKTRVGSGRPIPRPSQPTARQRSHLAALLPPWLRCLLHQEHSRASEQASEQQSSQPERQLSLQQQQQLCKLAQEREQRAHRRKEGSKQAS